MTNTTSRLPFPSEEAELRKITPIQWKVLCEQLFPLVNQDGILSGIDFCKERDLDIFQDHVSIIPRKIVQNGIEIWLHDLWPTIASHVYIAHKTGEFAGMDEVIDGPKIEKSFNIKKKVNGAWQQAEPTTFIVPEYCTATVYRIVKGQRCAFSERVRFDESVNMSYGAPTHIWQTRPYWMLAKCAKAAALRLAFTECQKLEAQPELEEVHASNVVPIESGKPETIREAHPDTLENSKEISPKRSVDCAQVDFSQVSLEDLNWVDRTLPIVVATGDEIAAIQNLEASLEPNVVELVKPLFQAAKAINNDPRSVQIFDFISKAVQTSKFVQAKAEFDRKLELGQIEQTVFDACSLILKFQATRKEFSSAA